MRSSNCQASAGPPTPWWIVWRRRSTESRSTDGHWIVSVSLKNIGGMTSGAAEVEISVDGEVVGSAKTALVPARSSAMIYGEVVLRNRIKLASGERIIEARIVEAGSSEILDGSAAYLRTIP